MEPSSDTSTAPSSKKKPWEHPWTFDEMKKSAEQWNLSSDVGMLLHLQEFSQKLLKRTHEIQEQVDSLNHDTKLTNIRLHNVFNGFVMLANTQFVENRVYDEEVVVQDQSNGNKKTEEKEKTPQEKELELIPKIKQAISFGLNVFDTAYEKLDMNIADSESEDEDNSAARTNIILEPKDPYLLRPLPYLIGSEQFFHSDNLGLASLLVDESVDQDSDHLSDVEQAGPREVQPLVKSEGRLETSSSESDEDLFSESKKEANVKKVKDDEREYDDSDSEVTFGDNETKTAKSPMTDLQSELARKLGDPGAIRVPPKQPGSMGKDETPHAKPRSSKPVQQPSMGGGDIFGSAFEDPGDDIFSRSNLPFSSGPTLFDDEDSDSGGLFIPKKSSQAKQDQQIPAKTSDLSTPIDFNSRMTSTPQSAKGQEVKQAKNTKEKGLFDQDDDDDEEDLFATKSVVTTKKPKEIKKPETSLFNDDDEENDDSDIFGQKAEISSRAVDKSLEAQSKPKLPAGAVSIFGGSDSLLKAAILKTKKDDDLDDSNRPFIKPSSFLAQSSKPTVSTDTLRPTPGSSSPSSTVSNSSLFAEDPELFAAPSKSKPTTDHKKEPSQVKAKSGLSLFAADDDDDDLFVAMNKPLVSTGTKTLSKESEPAKKPTKLLFDEEDDDEGDLFSFSKASTVDDKKNLKLIDETTSKKSLPEITPTERKEPQKTQTQEPAKSKATKLSLFSSSDEDDDFFSRSSKKSPAKLQAPDKSPGLEVKKTATAGHSLFDDDDFLFGESNDNGPTVDLFKSSVSKKAEVDSSSKIMAGVSSSAGTESLVTAPIPAQRPAASKSKKASGKLFGSLDDDEDDLFSTLKAKPLQKPKTIAKSPEKMAIPAKSETKNEQKDIFEELFESKNAVTKNALPALSSIQDSKTFPAESFSDPLSLTTTSNKPQSKPAESTIPSKDPLAADNEFIKDTPDVTVANAHLVKEKSPIPTSPTSPKAFPKVAAKTSNRISQLQASMIIDPTAHLPQKITKKEENEDSVNIDFDLPPQTAKLHSLAKDRAKIPVKRRPPTRKHVEPQDDQSDGLHHEHLKQNAFSGALGDSVVQKTDVLHPFGDSLISEAKESSGAVDSIDELFGSNQKQTLVPSLKSANNITESRQKQVLTDDSKKTPDLKSTPVVEEIKSNGKPSKPTSAKFLASDYDDDDDLFSSVSKVAKTASAEKSAKSSSAVVSVVTDKDDDLFGESDFLSSSKKALPKQKVEREKAAPPLGKAETKSSVKPKTVIDDDDDDLFGVNFTATRSNLPNSSKAKTIASKREENLPKKPEEKVLSSDEDDIFSGPKKISAPSSKATSAVIKQPTADDDDIFASSNLAPKASSRPSKTKPVIQSPFNDDDDDDIFASIPPASNKAKTQPKKEQITEEDDLFGSSSRSVRPAYKKPMTTDEDLFRDDTDIFADIPSSKSKEKNSASKIVKPVTTDPDDIFAEAAATAKPKQTPSETQKSVPAAHSKDDYDDIFEDPLNVLKK